MKLSAMFHISSTIKKIVQKSKLKHKTYSKSEILKKWDTQVIKWDTQISEELVLISFFTFKKETIALPGKIVIL